VPPLLLRGNTVLENLRTLSRWLRRLSIVR
jgi:hypothetical protein